PAPRSGRTRRGPQRTPGPRSPAPTGTTFGRRRRGRAWAGVRPRASRLLAISSTLVWASASRHGSGCRREARARRAATAVRWELRGLTRGASAAGVEAGALLAAGVSNPTGIRAADRPRPHDVGLTNRV